MYRIMIVEDDPTIAETVSYTHLDGITLKELIQKKGKLDIRESIGVAMQVAQAIEAAHEHNIVPVSYTHLRSWRPSLTRKRIS